MTLMINSLQILLGSGQTPDEMVARPILLWFGPKALRELVEELLIFLLTGMESLPAALVGEDEDDSSIGFVLDASFSNVSTQTETDRKNIQQAFLSSPLVHAVIYLVSGILHESKAGPPRSITLSRRHRAVRTEPVLGSDILPMAASVLQKLILSGGSALPGEAFALVVETLISDIGPPLNADIASMRVVGAGGREAFPREFGIPLDDFHKDSLRALLSGLKLQTKNHLFQATHGVGDEAARPQELLRRQATALFGRASPITAMLRGVKVLLIEKELRRTELQLVRGTPRPGLDQYESDENTLYGPAARMAAAGASSSSTAEPRTPTPQTTPKTPTPRGGLVDVPAGEYQSSEYDQNARLDLEVETLFGLADFLQDLAHLQSAGEAAVQGPAVTARQVLSSSDRDPFGAGVVTGADEHSPLPSDVARIILGMDVQTAPHAETTSSSSALGSPFAYTVTLALQSFHYAVQALVKRAIDQETQPKNGGSSSSGRFQFLPADAPETSRKTVLREKMKSLAKLRLIKKIRGIGFALRSCTYFLTQEISNLSVQRLAADAIQMLAQLLKLDRDLSPSLFSKDIDAALRAILGSFNQLDYAAGMARRLTPVGPPSPAQRQWRFEPTKLKELDTARTSIVSALAAVLSLNNGAISVESRSLDIGKILVPLQTVLTRENPREATSLRVAAVNALGAVSELQVASLGASDVNTPVVLRAPAVEAGMRQAARQFFRTQVIDILFRGFVPPPAQEGGRAQQDRYGVFHPRREESAEWKLAALESALRSRGEGEDVFVGSSDLRFALVELVGGLLHPGVGL